MGKPGPSKWDIAKRAGGEFKLPKPTMHEQLEHALELLQQADEIVAKLDVDEVRHAIAAAIDCADEAIQAARRAS